MNAQRVSLDIQYQGAWNEFNTRIAQRQNVISIYTTLALAAIGAAMLPQDPAISYRMLFAIPVLSLLFAGLLQKHERMMDNLHKFLIECERVPDATNVGYHAGEIWDKREAKARLIHDWVCVTLIVGLNALAAVLLYTKPRITILTTLDHIVGGLLASCSLIAIWLVLQIGKIRHSK